MYCGRCGSLINGAANCPSCGEPQVPSAPSSASVPPPPPYTPPSAPPYATPYGAPPVDVSGKKIGAGICGILLGALGIHKFVLGYTKEGLIMLLTSILTCGIAAAIWSIVGIVEGILYLTKSDDEFYRTYVAGRKGWF